MTMKSLAFIESFHALLGEASRRPLSLGSAEVLRTLGVTVHLPGVVLGLEEESRQIRMYDAVHLLSVADLKRLVALGKLTESVPDELLSETTVATFRHMVELQNALLEECDFKVRARESEKKHREEPPGDMVYPSLLGARVARMAKETGWSRDFILWEMHLGEALQLLHTSHLGEGRWTVAIGQAGPMAEEEDLTPEWMVGVGNKELANG
jgi:hypothetical protein